MHGRRTRCSPLSRDRAGTARRSRAGRRHAGRSSADGGAVGSQLASAVDTVAEPERRGRSGSSRLATVYVHALWHHIDAENSVLFPECEPRLRRNGVTDLPSRPMDQAELEARAAGESLLRRYPPADLGDMVRGDGCIIVPGLRRLVPGARARVVERVGVGRVRGPDGRGLAPPTRPFAT